MKTLLLITILLVSTCIFARTVEVDVHGMTCAFCVDSLNKKFKAMDAVLKVDVSLKNNKIRLETKENQPSIQAIKKTILDAGFTPVAVKVLNNLK